MNPGNRKSTYCQNDSVFQLVLLAWFALASDATEVQVEVEMNVAAMVEVKQNKNKESNEEAVQDEAREERVR